MSNPKKWIIALFAVLLLAGCHKTQRLDKPDNLINRNTMIEMMADCYIVEAIVYMPFDGNKEFYCERLYAQMFKKYNVSKEAFISSLTYYLSEKDMATDFLQAAAEMTTKRRDDYYAEMRDVFEADSLNNIVNEEEQ